MKVSSERKPPVKRALQNQTVVVKFDAERLKAPFLLRCGAFLIDYIILIFIPVISLLISRYAGMDGAKLITESSTGWFIAFIVGFTNFVILPMINGQSIGKMLTGLSVVKTNGEPPAFSTLLLRHLAGYLLTFLTFGLGFLFSVFNPKGRALHDVVAGTIVIYGQKRVSSKIIE